MVFTSVKFRSSAHASNAYVLWQRHAVSCVALALGVAVLQKSQIFPKTAQQSMGESSSWLNAKYK